MKYQKGVAIYITFVILSMVLASVIGLNSILILQLKSARTIGNSLVAFYAADSGVEQVLKLLKDLDITGEKVSSEYLNYPSTLAGGITYEVETFCCDKSAVDQCFYKGNPGCPIEQEGTGQDYEDKSCSDPNVKIRFCVRVVGSYLGTKRAIEVKVL